MYRLIVTFCNALTAASQYFKQTHLCAANGGHAVHVITQSIYKHLDDDIDRLKELAISVFNEKDIAVAITSLTAAVSYCNQLPNPTDTASTQEMLQSCLQLLQALGEGIEEMAKEANNADFPFKQGILNALGDISEQIARDKYLLAMEIK